MDSCLENYIKNGIRNAISNREIEVYYQPVIHAMSMKISSYEALARWNSKEFGMISPAAFIPTLEKEHLSADLDLHMVELVLKDFKTRKEAGMNVIPVSVNISKIDLETKDMVKEICDLTDRYGIDHGMLIVEITESVCTTNPERLSDTINRLHEEGFRVWMDDFGTGYSALNLLQKFNFDLIKLDMRFLENFAFSSRGAIVLRHIIQMAEELGIETLVEGVETNAQMIFLKSMGALYLQGFHFSKPYPLSHFVEHKDEGLESIAHESVCDYYNHITVERESLNYLPDIIKERMKALPHAILEDEKGMLIFLKTNVEYIEFLGNHRIVDPTLDYGDNLDDWKVKTPKDMARAIIESKKSKQWIEFDADGNRGYVYVLAEDPTRNATCFRIILDSAK